MDDYHTKDRKTTLRLESLERVVISRVESGPLAILCGSLYLSLACGPKFLVNIVVFEPSVMPSTSYDILNIFLYTCILRRDTSSMMYPISASCTQL